MSTLDQLTAENLAALPRARDQHITRSVGGWRHKLADAGASQVVLEVVDEYDLLPSRDRFALAELLRRYSHEPVAQTAIVFLWGGARGSNSTLAVCEPPRVFSSADAPWLRDDEDPQRQAHAFLWDPRWQWDDQPGVNLVAPHLAFQKLWAQPRWSQALLQGCGTAFGTKLLYWAARGWLGMDTAVKQPIPLIYDVRVFASLLRRAPSSVGGAQRAWTHRQAKMSSYTYESYCAWAYDSAQTLNLRAREVGVEADFQPDDIERWHIDLGGDNPTATVVTAPKPAPEGAVPERLEPDAAPPENYTPPARATVDRVLRVHGPRP